MLEVVFKSGALLPEEFIADVMMLVIRHNVKLIAFHDIKYIGTSYPFLIDSGTSGTLFISAFIHIMRNYGVDVIMTSSECDFEPSDFEMKKTVALSDALLRFERKPEDEFSVVISGEGQMIHNQQVDIQVLNGKQKAPKGKQRVIHTSFHIYKRDRDGKVMESKDTALLNAFSITAQARPSESETRQLTDQ